MNLPAAALFDLDGVLIDTEPVYTRIWNEIDAVHPTGIDNFALKIKGNTLPRILSQYYPDPEVQAEVCRMLAEREATMEYPIFPGVEEFLCQLDRAGIPSAIVTSSGDAKMRRLFDANPTFAAHFSALITDSSVTHSKPHPEPYLKGAEALGVDPRRCIVFEDSFAGLQAGRAAGAKVVALATTNPRERLAEVADVVIDNFAIKLDDLLASIP